MSRRRLPVGLLAPIALVVLVVALGVLQYRWVGQVSERDRDQLRQSLDRRAREFADDFDREIGRAYQVFQPDAGFTAAKTERFAKQYDDWLSSSPFPGLVKGAFFAEAKGDGFTLYRFDPSSRRFEAVSWPDGLEPVRARLLAMNSQPMKELAGPAGVVAFTSAPVLPNIPAIVMPVPEADGERMPRTDTGLEPLRRSDVESTQPRGVVSMTARGGTMNMTVTVRSSRNHVVLELDRAFITSDMLPVMAARHFPEAGSDAVRLSVTDGGPRPLFVRGLPPGQSVDAMSADAVATFFGLRLEMYRTASARGGAAGAGGGAGANVGVGSGAASGPTRWPPALDIGITPEGDRAMTATVMSQQDKNQFFAVIEQTSSSTVSGLDARGLPSRWTLLLQHSAGSLEAAVAQARRRNLLLSFGILGVLAASAGLVMINARRAERLAVQQMDFVAAVSHELRTPLAVIRSAAQNLSAGVVHEPGHATRYGDLIESEGRRLTDMIEQVLEYAGLSDTRRRISSGPVNAPAVVRDVVAAFTLLPEAADIAFDVKIDPDVPAVLADEEALRRALHNLIGNAVKHAGEGGWVGVNVARGHGDRGSVDVSVADRGPGISADDLPHVFEPFYRGRQAIDRQIRGNGLGLSLVKLMVEAHGGRVTVTSASGQGSTFTMHMPVGTGAGTGAV